jgi:hypothetical protein
MAAMRRMVIVTLGAGLVPAAVASASTGEVSPIVVSGGPYELEDGPGGTTSLTLTVINLSGSDVQLALVDPSDVTCTAAEDVNLGAGTSAEVTFDLPATCDAGDNGIDLELAATTASQEVAIVPIAAGLSDDATDDPDYGTLGNYVGATVASLVVVIAAYVLSSRPGLISELPGIADDWSFTDSWASNIGVAAALFTGLFGATDVLETILGDEGKNQVAVSVVSAALAAGLIGVGPLLLIICRRGTQNRHTVMGILLASTVVLAANLGLVWVMHDVLLDGDVINDRALDAAALVAAGLLIVYTLRSIPQTLATGATESPSTESDEILGARMISDAILTAAWLSSSEGGPGADLDDWRTYPLGTSPGDELPHSSAML